MKRSILVIFLVLLGLGALGALGYFKVVKRNDKAEATTVAEVHREPGVHIVPAGAATDTLGLTLPARIEAKRSTDLYARAQGYVSKWTVDIGDHVTEGQLLVSITQPEIGQDIANAKSQLDLARVNLERYQSVTLPGAISQAEMDQAKAQYRSAEAVYKRALELKNFQEIRAPFSGVITARNIEDGAFVTPGSTPLYSVQNDKFLRVFVDVPQSDMASAQVDTGMATLTIPDRHQTFAAKIVRNAGAFNDVSRTLTVQLDVPPGHNLLPGMYGLVTFKPRGQSGSARELSVPANAMYYSNKGPAVLVVTQQDTIAFRPVSIDKDFGTYVVISKGVAPGERMVVNPSSRLLSGTHVKIMPNEQPGKEGAKKS